MVNIDSTSSLRSTRRRSEAKEKPKRRARTGRRPRQASAQDAARTASRNSSNANYIAAINEFLLVCAVDPNGLIVEVNDEFVRVSKYSREDIIGHPYQFLDTEHHGQELYDEIQKALKSGNRWRSPLRKRAKDGTHYWVDAVIVPLKKGRRGAIAGYMFFELEITQAIADHIDLQERTRILQGLVDQFPGGISVFDKDLKLVLCNEMVKELCGYPPELFAKGMPTFEQIVRCNAERGEYGDGNIDDLVRSRVERARQSQPHLIERRRPTGTHLEIRGVPVPGGGFISTYIDVTGRVRDQNMIQKLAHHDPLTGLPNRLLFQDRIRQAVARAGRGEKFALHCLDLDRFKSVNDALGHPVGDQLLVAVSKRLSNIVRQTDTVARLGGDEFAIIQAGPTSILDIESVAKRVIAALSQPFKIGEHVILIGTSIGITLAPDDGTDADQLMQNADLALYKVKAQGRGAYGFFEPSMQSTIKKKNEIAKGLAEALENDGFALHYQPTIDMQNRRIIGCEALIRWSHPVRGLVPASEFIPVAEEAGLINRIGDWVLERACRDACSWPTDISVAVNISAAQIRGNDFFEKVTGALGSLHPSRLILEITESLFIKDKEHIKQVMDRLRKIGVRFALDDFGTGFSSLSYLNSLPFDKIKIDRSFVSMSDRNGRSAALRRAIVQLGQTLEMTTVAEGIETEEQFDRLRNEGCVEAQGYLFSKPVPMTSLVAMFGQPL